MYLGKAVLSAERVRRNVSDWRVETVAGKLVRNHKAVSLQIHSNIDSLGHLHSKLQSFSITSSVFTPPDSRNIMVVVFQRYRFFSAYARNRMLAATATHGLTLHALRHFTVETCLKMKAVSD